MKVGFVYPRNSRWPKWDWVYKATQNLGHCVHRIESIVDLPNLDETSDLVLFGQYSAGMTQDDLPPIAARRKSVWVQWWFDLLCAEELEKAAVEQVHAGTHLPMLRSMDAVLCKDRNRIEELNRFGVKAQWLDQGCPSDWQTINLDVPKKWDVLVFGQATQPNYRQRKNDVKALVAAGYRVAWADRWLAASPFVGIDGLEFCEPYRLSELMAQAKCVLSCDCRHDVDGYWSDRLWMILGAGAIAVRRESAGIDKGLPCLLYRDEESLLKAVETACRFWEPCNRQKLEDIHACSIRRVQTKETYECRLNKVLAFASSLRSRRQEVQVRSDEPQNGTPCTTTAPESCPAS